MTVYGIGYDEDGNALDFTTMQSFENGAANDDTGHVYYADNKRGVYWDETVTMGKRVNLYNQLSQPVQFQYIYPTFVCSGDIVWRGFWWKREIYSIQFSLGAGSSGSMTFDRCRFDNGPYVTTSNGAKVYFDSCLGTGTRSFVFTTLSGSDTYWRNCTSIGGVSHGFVNGHCFGCLAIGAEGDGFRTPEADSDYNWSTDGTAPGANSETNKRISDMGFGDPLTHGYWRPDYDSDLVGAGDPDNHPTLDLLGRTFAATPTIGCYEGVYLNDDRETSLESAGGDYHEAIAIEVQDGVTFGPSESYTGSYDPVGPLEVKIDAIKAKTDSLTFTESGVVDSNVKYVADLEVTGTGTRADPWGPTDG